MTKMVFIVLFLPKTLKKQEKLPKKKSLLIMKKRFASAVEVKIDDKARLLCTCLEDDIGEDYIKI